MTDNQPRSIRIATVVALFAVFLAGLATGAAIVHLTRPHGPPGPPPPAPTLKGIELTAEQRRQIDAIQDKYRPQLDAIFQETFPRVRGIEDRMNAEIRPLLTPDQQKRFDDNAAHRPPLGAHGPPRFGGPPPGGPFPGGPPPDGPPPDGPPPGAP